MRPEWLKTRDGRIIIHWRAGAVCTGRRLSLGRIGDVTWTSKDGTK